MSVFAPALVSTSLGAEPAQASIQVKMCKNVLVSNAGDFSTTLEMTSCSPGWRRGEGAPPYRSEKTTFQTNTCPRRLAVGRGRTPLPRSINRYICHFYNVISTEVRVQNPNEAEKSPAIVVRQRYSCNILDLICRHNRRRGGSAPPRRIKLFYDERNAAITLARGTILGERFRTASVGAEPVLTEI